jgi:hypothetical protein
VVSVHPTTPDCCRGLVPGIPPGSIEYATDSTRPADVRAIERENALALLPRLKAAG